MGNFNFQRIFNDKLKHLTDDELEMFIPDVYQEDIYQINYSRLKDKGIKVISFDADDTISDILHNAFEGHVPVKAVKKIKELKEMGFKVALLTNADDTFYRAYNNIAKDLRVDYFIYDAEKPTSKGFKELSARAGVTPAQMAHVGNDIRKDIGGGNFFGVTTCLVRNNGSSMKILKALGAPIGIKTKGHKLRKVLKKRGLWRKHHDEHHDDQYYQLGEEPAYNR